MVVSVPESERPAIAPHSAESSLFPSPGARAILERISRVGEAFLVGGAVRDQLMGRPAQDEDIASSLPPEDLKRLFLDCRTLETGIRHGTLSIFMDGRFYEVTRFRRDGPYSDGRHPDYVDFSVGIEDDLARRDFTLNAMALDLEGHLLDPFHGRDDIKNRKIRAVGDPFQRFDEDALRLLRAIRFANRFHFELEEKTAEALRAKAPLLLRIAPERIADEFLKIVQDHPDGVTLLHEYGLLSYCFPELEACFSCTQELSWHLYDVGRHSVLAATQGGDLRFRLAALCHDLGKPLTKSFDEEGRAHFYGHAELSEKIAETMLARLYLPEKDRRVIQRAVALHDTLTVRPSKIARIVREEDPETIQLLIQLKYADVAAQSPLDYEKKIALIQRQEAAFRRCLDGPHQLSDLAVDGKDMLALGMRGKEIGEMLERLLVFVMEEPGRNRRPYLMERARCWFLKSDAAKRPNR